jgi:thioredoxin reductase (NADPH)
VTITAELAFPTGLVSAEQAQLLLPKLSDEQLATLMPYGTTEPMAPGQVLYAAGDRNYDLMVVLEGEVEASDTHEGCRRPIVMLRPRDFIAELGLLTGQRAFTTCVVVQPGSVLRVPRHVVKAVIEADGALGELLVQTMFRRREKLLTLGAGVQIVGSRYSPDTQRLREFATRNRLAHAWVDLDTDPGAPPLLRSLGFTPHETPVVLLGGDSVLANPSNAELATAAGIAAEPQSGSVFGVALMCRSRSGNSCKRGEQAEGRATRCRRYGPHHNDGAERSTSAQRARSA